MTARDRAIGIISGGRVQALESAGLVVVEREKLRATKRDAWRRRLIAMWQGQSDPARHEAIRDICEDASIIRHPNYRDERHALYIAAALLRALERP